MHILRTTRRRKGASLIEVAIIIPVMIVLVALAVDLSMGVFRYQQVSTLARASSRYASVHAGQYAAESGQPVCTVDTLNTNVIQPMSVGLSSSSLTCTLSWVPNGVTYPSSDTTSTGQLKQNLVRVAITYQWQPVFLLGGAVNLTSTSEMAISY